MRSVVYMLIPGWYHKKGKSLLIPKRVLKSIFDGELMKLLRFQKYVKLLWSSSSSRSSSRSRSA